MKISGLALFLLAASWSISAPHAEEPPGADDPDPENSGEGLASGGGPAPGDLDVGELAVEGNTAARLLANTMFYECGSDFPEMSREESWRCFSRTPTRKEGSGLIESIDPSRPATITGLTNDLKDEPPPTEEELQRLGALLIRDAARTPYLRPNLNACESACPDDIFYCMASGVLNRVELRYMPTYLQPIVPAMTYYDSPRAMRALLVESGGMARRRGWGPDWLRVPQCFSDAAGEAVDRRYPRPAASN